MAVSDFLQGRPWSQTRFGRAFPLIDPEPSDVHWPDIAYALAHSTRFAGHAGGYTIAQHCCLVSDNLPHDAKLYGLLHDAHEFVTGDITTPAVRALRWIVRPWANGQAEHYVSVAVLKLKAGIDNAIFRAADLAAPMPQTIAEAVHIADERALMTECRDLMEVPPASWGFDHVVPYPERIVDVWPADKAMARYVLALQSFGIDVET